MSTENIFKSEGEIKMISGGKQKEFSFSRPARRKMMPDKSMYPNKRIKMRKHASTYGDMSMVTPLVNVMSFKNNEISLKHN